MSVTYFHLEDGQEPPSLSFGSLKCVVVAKQAVDARWRAAISMWLVERDG